MIKKRAEIWTIKHKPKRIEEIIGNNEAKQEFIKWLELWIKKKPPIKKSVLIYGPPGIGKTLLAETAAKQYNLELIEINAGDIYSLDYVKKIAVATSKEISFEYKMKLILIDEIDSIEGSKALTIINTIVELINKTSFPVVLIANDGWKPDLWIIRNRTYMIEMKKLSLRQIQFYLEKICKIENLPYEIEALKIIAERSSGDMRSAILDLQFCSLFKKVTVNTVNILSAKDRQTDIFTAVRRIIYSTTIFSARNAVEESPYDPETLLLWINENIHRFYTNPLDLANAFDMLSKADIYRSIMQKQRYWRFMLYFIELMSAGVALSKSTKPSFSRIQFPESLRLLSKQKKSGEIRKNLIKTFAKKTHMSTKKATTELFWYLLIMLKNNEYRKKFFKKLRISKLEEEYLTNLTKSIEIKIK